MIPYDLVYLRPSSATEAVQLFEQTRARGLEPAYYAGGTEILSFIRRNKIRPGALIDIKEIPGCRAAGGEGEHVYFGAASTLNEIIEADPYPLLSAACRRIADHTVRNRLTLGGNICGHLPYREAVLPQLVGRAEAEVAGLAGSRWESLDALFEKRLRLRPEELLLRVRVGLDAVCRPWFHGRRQRGTRVDYPLVTCCLLQVDGKIRLAFSGACGYPLRDPEAEKLLGDPGLDRQGRVERIVARFASWIRSDFRASAEYRSFLFARILAEALEELRGEAKG
jgi:CO/xanthine dehydrogenase FAD-binding subunit